METKNETTTNKRDSIAILIISITGILLLVSSVLTIIFADDKEITEKVFFALLPMFGTWIGAVIAYYFGEKNFNTASNKYEKIIKTLSPDVLDDIAISQIMIAKKTMLTKNLDDLKGKSVKEIVEFLNEIDKSRLPVLESGKIKYIIHKTSFLEALSKHGEDLKFDDFAKKYQELITTFNPANKDDSLEKVRKNLTEKEKCKDVFVSDSDGKLIGWLTDSLIFRYLNSQ